MIQPIKSNLLVRLKTREEISKGGIHIPEAAQQAEEWGVVEAVGKQVENIAVDDVVFIRATQGTHYQSGGHDYIIIDEPRILCKITD